MGHQVQSGLQHGWSALFSSKSGERKPPFKHYLLATFKLLISLHFLHFLDGGHGVRSAKQINENINPESKISAIQDAYFFKMITINSFYEILLQQPVIVLWKKIQRLVLC